MNAQTKMQSGPIMDNATPVSAGLAVGTEVITMDGLRAVEALQGGERIVTRSGARLLRGVEEIAGQFRLKFDLPEVVYLETGQIHSDTCQPFAA